MFQRNAKHPNDALTLVQQTNQRGHYFIRSLNLIAQNTSHFSIPQISLNNYIKKTSTIYQNVNSLQVEIIHSMNRMEHVMM